MQQYGEACEELIAQGWPVDVKHFGKFGKFTGKRPDAFAWAHQNMPGREYVPNINPQARAFNLQKNKSMIEHKATLFKDTEKWRKTMKDQQDYGWLTRFDRVDKELATTLIHETAHSMLQFRQAGTSWEAVSKAVKAQAEQIHNRYLDMIRKTRPVVEQKYKEWYFIESQNASSQGRYLTPAQKAKAKARIRLEVTNNNFVSEYAEHNLEEFWAESFTHVYGNSNPSPYARELVDLVKNNIKKPGG